MLIRNGAFYLGDCLEIMAALPAASADMILCDLPYGTTQNAWDSLIPFEPLWREYWRVAKPTAAVVLTAAQPFTSALVASQLKAFRYEWVYGKAPTGALNARRQPMRAHESVLVFGKHPSTYNPQGLRPSTRKRPLTDASRAASYNPVQPKEYVQEQEGFPSSLIGPFPQNSKKFHPTQKPVPLFEYLIRTYTNDGETVLDNCMGSGTTAIACERTGRKWIGIEKDETYYWNAVARLCSGDT